MDCQRLADCYVLFDMPRLVTNYKELNQYQSAAACYSMIIETYLRKRDIIANVVLKQLVYRF